LDQSGGSLTALVESARAVALRNSTGLGTIIRIKGAFSKERFSNIKLITRRAERRYGSVRRRQPQVVNDDDNEYFCILYIGNIGELN